MTTETITLTILKASEGMILTDGKEYGTTIYLGEGRSKEEYGEITQEEYKEIMKQDMPEELREELPEECEEMPEECEEIIEQAEA